MPPRVTITGDAFGPSLIWNGTRARAVWTSGDLYDRPISRLTEYTVFCGSMTLRCLAAAPTTTPPLGWNDTTDGWIL